MQQRLGRAAEQLHGSGSEVQPTATSAVLRREQLRVFDDAAEYLLDAAKRRSSPWTLLRARSQRMGASLFYTGGGSEVRT